MSAPEVPSIDVAEAARLAADDAVVLLDVREPHEWLTGHAPGARHVPLGDLHAGAVPTGRPVVAVCRSGNRSGGATAFLRQAGLDVRNLDGGMKAWAAAGHPVVTDDGRPGSVA